MAERTSVPTAGAAATAASRYEALKRHRDPFLIRGRQCAALTVPYLCPPEGFNVHSQLPTPFQSLGARGVRTLSSKLLISLFPPNTPFFKYSVDDLTMRQLEQRQGDQNGLRGEVEAALSARERAILQEMESALFRTTAYTVFQHLLVTGNALVYVPKTGRSRVFRLDQYVVRRGPEGGLLELIIHEKVAPASLRDKLLRGADVPAPGAASDEEHLDLYTVILREGDRWVVHQELEGALVPETDGSYTLDQLPWLPLRLSIQPGESYGRSYVEEYLGDLDSLEGLVETIVEGSAAVARVVFMVSPNGSTSLRLVSSARSGDVIPGEANDVSTIQAQKQADLGVARQQATEIAQGISASFMLNSAIQRTGERVTAEEIRYMAAELDAALGGVYTLLGGEFQLPVVNLFSTRMEKNRNVPALPKDMVQPTIVTGMEAIGRGQNQRNLSLFVKEIIQVVGPELAFRKINLDEFLKRAAADYGIDTQGLIVSDEELAQQQQQQMLMQMIQQLGPDAITQLGGMGKEVVKGAVAQQTAAPTQGMNPNG